MSDYYKRRSNNFLGSHNETVLQSEQNYTVQKMLSCDMFGIEDIGARVRFVVRNNLGNFTRKEKNHLNYSLITYESDKEREEMQTLLGDVTKKIMKSAEDAKIKAVPNK